MGKMSSRVSDSHQCPLVSPAGVPHVGGPIIPPGAPKVYINGSPAARIGDHSVCIGAPPDTIRGGTLSVFMNGSPASRITDKTDAGTITQGSGNVHAGDWAGGPLSQRQAQWLYDYLKSQQDIPFEFATDGCFARADRMAKLCQDIGIDVQKQWVYATPASGPLHVPIAGYPGGGVTWGYHVAPSVEVLDAAGNPVPLVMDPSLGPGPQTVDGWVGQQTSSPTDVISNSSGPDVYYKDATGGHSETSNASQTNDHLNDYRTMRASLPASSGRRVSNMPVHY